jgi:hypothetical protein
MADEARRTSTHALGRALGTYCKGASISPSLQPIGGVWNKDQIEHFDRQLKEEKEAREALLSAVLKLEANLWPSREAFGTRMLAMVKRGARKGISH